MASATASKINRVNGLDVEALRSTIVAVRRIPPRASSSSG